MVRRYISDYKTREKYEADLRARTRVQNAMIRKWYGRLLFPIVGLIVNAAFFLVVFKACGVF